LANSRDDFLDSVKIQLAGRVGWVCSFPGCGQSTAGPSRDSEEKMIKNGIAAHIRAAAKGGPRYDENMTPEQRRHINNGIWMCPTHGSLIDKEETAYTTEQIRAWKINAEASAARQLEYKQPFFPPQIFSRYSAKDTKILSAYSEIFSFSAIEIIRGEPFGNIVKHEVINPLYAVLNMQSNPAYSFQDTSLEHLRQTLYSNIWAFLNHFGQQSAGLLTHYEYINIYELTKNNPENRVYWERQVYQSQLLAQKICNTAIELLSIKENN
jgi:hypothetical protein